MKGITNIGLILILTLAMFFVPTANAALPTTKTYNMNILNPCTFTIQKGYTDVKLDYFPKKAGSKIFEIYRTYPTPGAFPLYLEDDFKATVYFYWSNDGKVWNSFGPGNEFGLKDKSVTQTLYSGSSNIRFQMRVFSSNSLIPSTVKATIKDSIENTPVTLKVSPSSGKQGTKFTFSGTGYTPNGAIDYHVRKPDNTEYPVTTLTASSSGVLSYTYPSTTASMVGTYTIWAIDRSTGRQSKEVKETITEVPVTLTVSPGSGKQGTTFTFSGNGYTANGAIDFHVRKPDNTEYPVTTLTASSSGVLSYKYQSTTSSMVGTYNIWAIDRSTGRQSKEVKETIKK